MANSSLVEGLGFSEISLCLEREPLAPGWLTWGGALTAEQKKATAELQVVGQRHWAVTMGDLVPVMPLTESQRKAAGTLLCDRGCAAILDSGTSLISAPSHALTALEMLLPKLHSNCSNFDEMPDLELLLGGHRVKLPPEAYVMRLQGSFFDAKSVWDKLHSKPSISTPDQCFFAFLQMDMHTDFGPLWVLGMPFFRFFHVTFGFSRVQSERRVWLAGASEDCEPLPLDSEVEDEEGGVLYDGVGVYPKVVVTQRHSKRHRLRPREPLTVDAKSLVLPKELGATGL